MRISDILSLNISDVKDKEVIKIIEKKTKKCRIIPLNNQIKKDIKLFVNGKSKDGPLFINQKNKERLSRISVYRIIRQACKKAEINGSFGTHTLRKTFG